MFVLNGFVVVVVVFVCLFFVFCFFVFFFFFCFFSGSVLQTFCSSSCHFTPL